MTELTWEGKYFDGRRSAPVRIALPFQTVETVNESAQERQRTLDLLTAGQDPEWRNRLIWGDKKYVLPSLLPEFGGCVDLIYIDPPFDTGADFSYPVAIPEHEAEEETGLFVKEPSILEQKAYRDTWGRGLDSYLQWFFETVVLLRELLVEDGSIFVHLDWHAGHYAKVILDEVFGIENFRNQIAWYYYNRFAADGQNFGRKYDMIFWYSKGSNVHYRPIDEVRDEPQRRLLRKKVEGVAVNVKDEDNKLVYYDQTTRRVDDVWRIPLVPPASGEFLNYPTQKPQALVERIITACSNEGDLVFDCFVGSGTAVAAAELSNRRWIACDLSRFAVHTTRKRLLGIPTVRPFMVQNLGKYERQAWQAAEFAAPDDLRQRESRYREFILDLYHATPISGHAWLHGVKRGRMVHVGPVDAPITLADVKALAAEVWRSVGQGEKAPKTAAVDVLGWEFAFELHELARQIAAEAKVEVSFKKIPREVLDKRAVEQGDIRFFELAALTVDMKVRKRDAALTIKDFVLSPEDLPEEARRAIRHWSQCIDYWAVDWDYKVDTFHNQWQTYRTRKNRTLGTTAEHTYEKAGHYTILIKAIDILGNDTTKAIDIEVS
jgi:adenine-specific DNA-methyltransferase